MVGDNLSTDHTLKILHDYQGLLELIVAEDHEELHYHEHKMDILGGIARTQGAEWVVPMDADEFWYGGKSAWPRLTSTPRHIAIQSAKVHNVVKISDDYRMGATPDRLPKVAYRWHPIAHLYHGNHGVDRPGQTAHDLRILHF